MDYSKNYNVTIEFVESETDKGITQFWIDRCLRLEAENLELRNIDYSEFEDWFSSYKTVDSDYPHIKAYHSAKTAFYLATKIERERCAKICESFGVTLANSQMLAECIRGTDAITR